MAKATPPRSPHDRRYQYMDFPRSRKPLNPSSRTPSRTLRLATRRPRRTLLGHPPHRPGPSPPALCYGLGPRRAYITVAFRPATPTRWTPPATRCPIQTAILRQLSEGHIELRGGQEVPRRNPPRHPRQREPHQPHRPRRPGVPTSHRNPGLQGRRPPLAKACSGPLSAPRATGPIESYQITPSTPQTRSMLNNLLALARTLPGTNQSSTPGRFDVADLTYTPKSVAAVVGLGTGAIAAPGIPSTDTTSASPTPPSQRASPPSSPPWKPGRPTTREPGSLRRDLTLSPTDFFTARTAYTSRPHLVTSIRPHRCPAGDRRADRRQRAVEVKLSASDKPRRPPAPPPPPWPVERESRRRSSPPTSRPSKSSAGMAAGRRAVRRRLGHQSSRGGGREGGCMDEDRDQHRACSLSRPWGLGGDCRALGYSGRSDRSRSRRPTPSRSREKIPPRAVGAGLRQAAADFAVRVSAAEFKDLLCRSEGVVSEMNRAAGAGAGEGRTRESPNHAASRGRNRSNGLRTFRDDDHKRRTLDRHR